MDIRIKTTDYQAPAEVSAHIDSRVELIEKALPLDQAEHARCEVEVGKAVGNMKHGEIWFAEINLNAAGKRMRATAEAENVNMAIDEAKDEIIRQLRKHQQLHRRILRKGESMIKNALRFGRE
ncbi:HPF/RaiA family ribosome-associated protein [Candidatus Kaiserbacteria bacterium]|nr:HPF/RaiA family ribosome-associated protein [Candidatus Kaiserbacteria bacterium]